MIITGGIRANGSFHWSDGTDFEYTNWIDGEPHDPSTSDYLPDCIAMQFGTQGHDGQWNAFTTKVPFKYICKKSGQGNYIVFLPNRDSKWQVF